MNRFMASNVVCCEPVAVSPEACVRFCATLPENRTKPAGGLPALKTVSSDVATARWLALRPAICPRCDVSVSSTSLPV